MDNVEYVRIKRTSAINLCRDCKENNMATHRCRTCRSYLCAQCVQAHSQLKPERNHSLLPLKDLLESSQADSSELELSETGTSDVATHTQEELQASASSDLTRVQYTEFPLCGDCVNTAKCQVNSDVITNTGGGTTQSDTPHTHPVCPSPHSSHPPSPSPPFPLTPSSSSPSPSPPSVSPPPPQFRRLNTYWGTVGRVVLEKGRHYWKVEATFQSKQWGQNWWLSEMGVVSLGEQDSGSWMLGNTQSAWGVDVQDCGKHRCLCLTGWEGKNQVCHIRMDALPAPGSEGKIRVGLLLDLEAGTLVCLDATRGVRLCTLHHLRPPLTPCFAMRSKSQFFDYDISLKVVNGGQDGSGQGTAGAAEGGGRGQ